MPFCKKCGNEITGDEKFCGKCGMNFQSAESSDEDTKGMTSVSNMSEPQVNGVDLITPDEQVITSLGNGYAVNLLYGNAKKCRVVLSNKRLYLSGAFYTGNLEMLTKTNIEQIIDVEDITGTGFVYSKLSKWRIIVGILTLPTIIIGIILLAKAFLDRKTFFFIQYAGGSINFDAHLIGMADVKDFHVQIRRVKDSLRKQKN